MPPVTSLFGCANRLPRRDQKPELHQLLGQSLERPSIQQWDIRAAVEEISHRATAFPHRRIGVPTGSRVGVGDRDLAERLPADNARTVVRVA